MTTRRRRVLPARCVAPGARYGQDLMAEPLTDREREMPRHMSDMLNTAGVTSEMYIWAGTVTTCLNNIYRGRPATHRGERSAESASSA
jgi:hypothetical protein